MARRVYARSMTNLVMAAGWSAAWVLALTGALHAVPYLGARGRSLSERAIRAPGLDVVVALLTWAPWVASALGWGWWGFFGSILGECVALGVWVVLHEVTHLRAARG